jgi:hypothetical protein
MISQYHLDIRTSKSKSSLQNNIDPEFPVINTATGIPRDEITASWVINNDKVVGLILDVGFVEGLEGIPTIVGITSRVNEPEVVSVVEWGKILLSNEGPDIVDSIIPLGETIDNILGVADICGVVIGKDSGGAGVVNPVGKGRGVENKEGCIFMISILEQNGRVLTIRIHEITANFE